jgi:hypothetical protein
MDIRCLHDTHISSVHAGPSSLKLFLYRERLLLEDGVRSYPPCEALWVIWLRYFNFFHKRYGRHRHNPFPTLFDALELKWWNNDSLLDLYKLLLGHFGHQLLLLDLYLLPLLIELFNALPCIAHEIISENTCIFFILGLN